MSAQKTAGQPSTGTQEVAVIATGTIGVSWTALFLAHGHRVRAYDTRGGFSERVRSDLREIAPTLDALGLPTGDLAGRLVFADSLESAVAGAEVVQESGPEDLDLKRAMFAAIERATGAETLLLSSTSALPASELAAQLSHPERLLVGHPFNPPHLVPLVEVVPGEHTSTEATAAAVAFYSSLGKRPVVVQKEIAGFVANRLQAALFRECVHLVEQSVIDVAGLDEIVTSSLGLRWAAQGPFLSFDLGGGSGGMAAFFEHLGPALQSLWETLGSPQLDGATVARVTEQAERSYGSASVGELMSDRDHRQVAILNAIAGAPGPRRRSSSRGQ